jgi:flagellar hook assembly protein FlgD
LLVTGAPATLIGWTDHPVDTTNNVTVNGASPGGTHDDFVQVPLNVDLSTSSNLTPGLITGQVINAQGNEVRTTSAGVYTIKTGSITFEFTLPDAGNLQMNNLTISEPVVVQTAGINQAQARLYNWNTNSWDAITLNNFSFTTTNIKAYTSSDGRVLLQVVNQNASQGELYFGKPSLSLNNPVN